jgi:alcohol dehydrogenase
MLSRETVRLLRAWLPRAVENLRDLEARYWLLYASMLAGIAIDLNGTHVVHLIEHVLSAMNPKLAHGCGLALLGPRAAYYIHKINPRASAAVLAALDPTIKPVPEDAEKAEKAVREFQRLVGFEEKLSDYGFTESDLQKIAEKSGNPLGLKTPEILDILKHSL